MTDHLSQTDRSASDGLRMDIDLKRQEITMHVGPEQIATLRRALDDAERGGKVFIGDKPMLIIRPVGWQALPMPDSKPLILFETSAEYGPLDAVADGPFRGRRLTWEQYEAAWPGSLIQCPAEWSEAEVRERSGGPRRS